MADIINNPPASTGGDGSGTGIIIGVVIVIVVVILLLLFGLPALRGTGGVQAPDVPEGAPDTGGDQSQTLNVDTPEQVDINVYPDAQ